MSKTPLIETPHERRFLPASLARAIAAGGGAGEPYRPSNGTEGDYFEAAWCNDCQHNDDSGCPILMAMMCHYTDEPGYPKQVQHAPDGHPICTNHKPERDSTPVPQLPSCPGQLELFA